MIDRIVRDITGFIFVVDEPWASDVILLPGGSDPAIPEKGVELYRSGLAPLLIASGGTSVKTGKFAGVKRKAEIYGGDYQTECAFYTEVLLKNGVPAAAIIGEDKSGYTKENALCSRKAADERGLVVRSAMVVCKSFHARRCLMYYALAFPEAQIRIIPVDVYGISRDTWHAQEYGVERVLGELARCGNQFVDAFKERL